MRLSDEFVAKVDAGEKRMISQPTDNPPPGRAWPYREDEIGAFERQRAALADLASKAIDSLTAGTPDNNEKASRKRRLIKGPEEFQDARIDRSTKK
jgi:hypothetical protein